jgi:hypothetical protein
MTADERLKLAFEAAERGDANRCKSLLAPIEHEIDRILTMLAETSAAMATTSRQ